MLLAENCWLGLLALFPAQISLEDGLHSCLCSLVKLPRWFGLSTIFISRQDYDLDFLPWQGSRMGPKACMAHCLVIQIGQECALHSLARQVHQFCSEDGEIHGICSLFIWDCKQGCVVGSTASTVIWLVSLVKQTDNWIQQ